MDKKVSLLKEDDWFNLENELNTVVTEFPDIRTYVLTGARGAGKTYSTLDKIDKKFKNNEKCLYIRNSKKDLPNARQYFSFLGNDGNLVVNLGSLGASSIVLENKDTDEKTLIGYTLFIGDYETLKSSKKIVDYVVYEEFSSFTNGSTINRVFSIIEIRETIRQTRPNFEFFAISNNIFHDDLFDNILNENAFVHWHIIKKTPSKDVKNLAIKAYLEGEYLVPDVVINLSHYKCLGYVIIGNSKLFIFNWDYGIPKYVVSSTGTGKQINLDTEVINWISTASYRSLKDRNKCEFLVGLIRFAGVKLRT